MSNLLGSKKLPDLDGQIHITICKTSQFDYKKAEILGYRSQSKFWSGITNDSSILTWSGLDDTLKFDEAFTQLFSSSDGVSLQKDFILERNEDVQGV